MQKDDNSDIAASTKKQKVAYFAFKVLGAISLWSSFIIVTNSDESGFVPPGIIGFMIILPLGVPLCVAIILGPGLSLIIWRDRVLNFLTAFTVLLLILIETDILRANIWPVLLVYGIVCLFCKNKEFNQSLKQLVVYRKAIFLITIFIVMAYLLLHFFAKSTSDIVPLSNHFATKYVRPFSGKSFTELYAREDSSSEYRILGITEFTFPDQSYSKYTAEEHQRKTIAVSDNGESLIYRHTGTNIDKKSGVYWYRIGKDEKELYSNNDLESEWFEHADKFPDILVFTSPDWQSEGYWSISTNDAKKQPLVLLSALPLHLAVYQNDFEQVRVLIEKNVDINSETFFGFTALEIAIKKGFDSISIFLIEKGADFDMETASEFTAKQLAVYLQRWDVINAINEKGGNLDSTELLLHLFGMREYSQFMSNNTTNYHPDDSVKLLTMVMKNIAKSKSNNVLKFNNAEVNTLKKMLKRHARDADTTASDIIYRHLQRNYNRGTREGKLDGLKLLIKYGFTPSSESYNEYSPLHLMVHNSAKLNIGYPWDDETRAILDLLISNMDSLEVKDRFGVTALQQSMMRLEHPGDFKKALYLIESGADDSVEYLCGAMRWRMGITIRQFIAQWEGKLPNNYDCSGHLGKNMTEIFTVH